MNHNQTPPILSISRCRRPATRATSTARILCATLLTAAAICSSRAQGVTGQVSGVASTINPGDTTYTVSLQNSASSLNSVAFIWFAWTPDGGYYGYGGDLLPSAPVSIQTPGGWTGTVSSGYYGGPPYDGYSIKFMSASTGLAPGASVTFQFDSPDLPITMGGNSSYPLYGSSAYPVLYSVFFQTTGETGDSGVFTPNLVPSPEPSTLAVLAMGAVGLLTGGRKIFSRRRA